MTAGELRTESRAIELGGATSVRARLKLGVGELRVVGGATALLDATFRYNLEEWRPEVTYDVRGDEGELTVRQPSAKRRETSGNIRNEWDLRFNDAVPLDLSIKAGVGTGTLTVGGLALTALAIETGVGTTTIDLAGGRPRDLDATIKGGVGKVVVRLPDAVGVRVETKAGVGGIDARGLRLEEGSRGGRFPFVGAAGVYVNDAYGHAPVTLRLAIESGVGQIELALAPAAAR